MKILKNDVMFLISLVWLVFPLYYSVESGIKYFPLITTILMAICFLASLYVKNKIVISSMWIYMCLYIIATVYFSNVANVLCFMYLSSLINYKYEETNFKTFKNIVFIITTICLIFIISLKITTNFEKLVGLTMLSVCVFMHFATRYAIIDRKNKEHILKQNEYINNLLAENERNRIGRDLHDTLGHIFAMLSLKSELSLKLLEKEKYDELKTELSEINTTTKKAMKDVRKIVHNISYITIEEELAISEKTLNLANINLEIVKKINLSSLNPTLQSTLSMVIRESINNIIKHSKATFVKITITEESNFIIMLIEDNGKGFTTHQELKNINSRVNNFGGSVKIENLKSPTIIKVSLSQERS